jgi:hypothetical protein
LDEQEEPDDELEENLPGDWVEKIQGRYQCSVHGGQLACVTAGPGHATVPAGEHIELTLPDISLWAMLMVCTSFSCAFSIKFRLNLCS